MKIGIVEEGKVPHDKRVAFNPDQCQHLIQNLGFEIYLEPSAHRCFADGAYENAGCILQSDLSNCDYLFGIKEVPIEKLIPDKNYFFFSHTIKQQSYNRDLLKAVLNKNVHLIDYECLTNSGGHRILGFGRFAGITGAYNTIRAIGERKSIFQLPPAEDCNDLECLLLELSSIQLPPVKIAITGGGRVAKGVREILDEMEIMEVESADFLEKKFDMAVFTQLNPLDYCCRKDGQVRNVKDFFHFPKDYKSCFEPYTKVADVLIAGHYWNPLSPAFFTNEDLSSPDFNIEVIGDLSCDIKGPIASTVRASTIADPFYAYSKTQLKETTNLQDPEAILVMAVDNLPCSLPKDASSDFGRQLIEEILPELMKEDSEVINRASIAADGSLGMLFSYLTDYVE